MMQPNDPQAPIYPSVTAEPRQTDWTSIAQLTLSGLGLGISLLAAGLFGVFGLVMVFGESGQTQEATAILGISWVSLFTAALAIPSIVLSLRRLLRDKRSDLKPAQNSRLRTATLALILWPLTILIGALISQETNLSWLVLPPLQLLIIAIPSWWLIELIRRGLPSTSPQRDWGIINFSVFITTPALMVIEILAIGILLVLFAFWVISQPDIVAQLEQIAEQIRMTAPNPQAIMDVFAPYLANPWVILGTLGLAAVLVPLIEELVKPLAIWMLAGRNLSLQEGFVAGALCGMTFGLVESLLYMTNPTGDGWAALAVGRTGTVLLHTATTALVGWGMTTARKDRSYLRLFGIYLLAAALHGLWNGLAILTGFGAVLETTPDRLPFIQGIATAAPAGIVVLGLSLFGVLLWGNRRLQQHSDGAARLVTASAEAQSDRF